MEDRKLETVGALLDKARSTPYAGEHEALAVRAYGLLATYLNALDPVGDTFPRKRERRLMRDRRQGQTPEAAVRDRSEIDLRSGLAPGVTSGGISAYRFVVEAGPALGTRLDVAL